MAINSTSELLLANKDKYQVPFCVGNSCSGIPLPRLLSAAVFWSHFSALTLGFVTQTLIPVLGTSITGFHTQFSGLGELAPPASLNQISTSLVIFFQPSSTQLHKGAVREQVAWFV